MNLPPIRCPTCENMISARSHDGENAPAATSYATCLRVCEACGIGYSNANTTDVKSLTRIWSRPVHMLPAELAQHWDEVLSRAVNESSRTTKRERFGFETSEDHVTWTIMRWLQLSNGVRSTLARAGSSVAARAHDEPVMLLWGAPVPPDCAFSTVLASALTRIEDAIGEDPLRRSEPDVVLDWGEAGIVFIEVKHRSGNDNKGTDYAGWSKYLQGSDGFIDPDATKASRHYELARNWRILCDVAGTRSAELVNLGPEALFKNEEGGRLDRFVGSLAVSSQRSFAKMPWSALIGAMSTVPDWLTQYIDDRGVGK